jgi:hypothetical protein
VTVNVREFPVSVVVTEFETDNVADSDEELVTERLAEELAEGEFVPVKLSIEFELEADGDKNVTECDADCEADAALGEREAVGDADGVVEAVGDRLTNVTDSVNDNSVLVVVPVRLCELLTVLVPLAVPVIVAEADAEIVRLAEDVPDALPLLSVSDNPEWESVAVAD